MQESIIQRFVEDEKSTKSSDQMIIVVLFWTREYFELEPQGEHSCREPGCDFTCRAALTLVRHQVLTCFQKLVLANCWLVVNEFLLTPSFRRTSMALLPPKANNSMAATFALPWSKMATSSPGAFDTNHFHLQTTYWYTRHLVSEHSLVLPPGHSRWATLVDLCYWSTRQGCF